MVEVFRLAQFEYDQLNRITASSTLAGAFANTFKTGYTYDPNGNLLTLNRFDKSGIQFDKLGYTYQNEKNGYVRNTNRLTSVSDISSDRLDDIEGQATDNYEYDEIGNLSRDESEKIKTIEWNTYGKVKRVERYPLSGKKDLFFEYDASGNRVLKTVVTSPIGSSPAITTTTYYLRDATGNVMATYEGTPSTPVSLQEQYLYGSIRVGVLSSTGRSYELTDHLGNVRTVVGADNKVLSASDYYPFGFEAKTFRIEGYRYGFNGQEKETELSASHTSAEFWMYDARLGRRWDLDPIIFADISPYSCFNNNPIYYNDPLGLSPNPPPLKDRIKVFFGIGHFEGKKIRSRGKTTADNRIWRPNASGDKISSEAKDKPIRQALKVSEIIQPYIYERNIIKSESIEEGSISVFCPGFVDVNPKISSEFDACKLKEDFDNGRQSDYSFDFDKYTISRILVAPGSLNPIHTEVRFNRKDGSVLVLTYGGNQSDLFIAQDISSRRAQIKTIIDNEYNRVYKSYKKPEIIGTEEVSPQELGLPSSVVISRKNTTHGRKLYNNPKITKVSDRIIP